MKQEQYEDLLREAEHYRLVKAAAQPGPKHLQRIAAALRKAAAEAARYLPSLKPANHAQA
jgi:hypothetical protein